MSHTLKYVLVIGDIISGIKLQGPFDSAEEAIAYAEEPPAVKASWHVAPLYPKSEDLS